MTRTKMKMELVMSEQKLPSQAKGLIVGGVMGYGLAYHLAHEGWMMFSWKTG